MILFLTDSAPDYGADWLAHGLFSVFGSNAVDYPVKPSLHGAAVGFDCDQQWPLYECPDGLSNVVAAELAAGAVELFVVPTLRGDVPYLLRQWSNVGLLDKVRDCTVCYDAEDHGIDTRQHFVDALGYEPAAYFKRELPIGATWARPLPFGYPEERIVPVVGDYTRSGFIYNAYLWEWARGGLREHLADALAALRVPGSMFAARSSTERISVKENHLRNQGALCAVSPAGLGWGTNRTMEIIADGCAPILQRPTVEFPDAFHAGTECLYFDGVDDCLSHVRTLLGDPAYATGMAQAAQNKLRSCHTTAVRARTVYEAVHG